MSGKIDSTEVVPCLEKITKLLTKSASRNEVASAENVEFFQEPKHGNSQVIPVH